MGLASVVMMGAMMGACCEGDTCALTVDDAGEAACEGLACAVATPGCGPEDIESAGGVVCATCDGEAGDVQICGAADVARCEAREDSTGDPCRICATSSGEILYDSCFSDAPLEVAVCEGGIVDPNSPGVSGSDGDVVCETCTDETGAVVTTVCEPVHDECHDVEDNGRTCRECTRDGAVVIHACEQPAIEPRSCQAYANELGRCIDCYDDEDQLLSHSCTLAEDVYVSCNEIVTAEGLRCQACVDRNGAQVARSCDTDVPVLQQCALLEYTEQSCVVCLDQFDGVAFASCEPTSCSPEAGGAKDECAPPPPCFYETSPDGSLCRSCPVGTAGDVEQRCVVETNLECTDLGANDPAAAGCLSCVDRVTQREVYRRCDGSGAPPPCETSVTADGTTCEVCNDPATQEPIYATCDGQTCYDLGRFSVTGQRGNGLVLDGAPAVAQCAECGVADGFVGPEGYQASCALRSDCGAPDLTNPSAVCEQAVVFRLSPNLCDNPWEQAGFSVDNQPGTTWELLVVLGYALETRGVGLISATRHTGGGAPCDNECACPRGDLIDVAVRAEDAIATTQLFDPIVRRCSADTDCEVGGTCRLDGACAY